MPVKQGQAGVAQEMKKFKAGTLHSGSSTGPTVTNRKQAIAISLNEAGLSKQKKAANAMRSINPKRNYMARGPSNTKTGF